jgi:hypothetical protein
VIIVYRVSLIKFWKQKYLHAPFSVYKGIMMFDATFSGIPVISWWPILLVEETGVYTLHIHCVSAPALTHRRAVTRGLKQTRQWYGGRRLRTKCKKGKVSGRKLYLNDQNICILCSISILPKFNIPALHNANGYVFNFKDVLYNGITRPMWKIKADILSETVRF